MSYKLIHRFRGRATRRRLARTMMKVSNKIFDAAKFIALVALPAIATLYLGFGQLWDFPGTENVVLTIVAVDTILGISLQISTRRYNHDEENFDGFLDSDGIHPDTGFPNLRLTINKRPEDILKKQMVRLKVSTPPRRQG